MPDDMLSTHPIVFVVEGTVGIQHMLDDGRRSLSAFYIQGDIVDLRRRSGPIRGNVVALTSAAVCRFDPDMYDEFLRESNAASSVASINQREQTHIAVDHSADLGKQRALEKLASCIFECHNRRPEQPINGCFSISVPMRHYDVADYLGLQPKTVSRGLRGLDSKDAISLPEPSHTVVKNTALLRRIANGAGA
ncbi:MAG: Crp/Fnr family transcriptional regulator [Rhodobacteraceae bacterium]|nr:Crp/Fnr family transcriptional regulator [Paracoccaceae bacterium]